VVDIGRQLILKPCSVQMSAAGTVRTCRDVIAEIIDDVSIDHLAGASFDETRLSVQCTGIETPDRPTSKTQAPGDCRVFHTVHDNGYYSRWFRVSSSELSYYNFIDLICLETFTRRQEI